MRAQLGTKSTEIYVDEQTGEGAEVGEGGAYVCHLMLSSHMCRSFGTIFVANFSDATVSSGQYTCRKIWDGPVLQL